MEFWQQAFKMGTAAQIQNIEESLEFPRVLVLVFSKTFPSPALRLLSDGYVGCIVTHRLSPAGNHIELCLTAATLRVQHILT